jgi:hypothetical protein
MVEIKAKFEVGQMKGEEDIHRVIKTCPKGEVCQGGGK